MSYTSYFYLLFFLGVLVALYYLMPLKKRWLVLLGGSYFFYWLASGKLIVFLLITTVSVYLGALAMEREQQAFDSVRKSLEKEERKARKAVMMRRKRHIVLAMVLINVGLLAFLKAADTRPNASFTLKLPKRIRGWIPPDADRMYDDRYNGWYDDYDEDAYEDYGYDDGYEDYDEYEDYDDYDQFAEDWTQDRGGWEDLIDGPLWPEGEDPLADPPPACGRSDERRRRR